MQEGVGAILETLWVEIWKAKWGNFVGFIIPVENVDDEKYHVSCWYFPCSSFVSLLSKLSLLIISRLMCFYTHENEFGMGEKIWFCLVKWKLLNSFPVPFTFKKYYLHRIYFYACLKFAKEKYIFLGGRRRKTGKLRQRLLDPLHAFSAYLFLEGKFLKVKNKLALFILPSRRLIQWYSRSMSQEGRKMKKQSLHVTSLCYVGVVTILLSFSQSSTNKSNPS